MTGAVGIFWFVDDELVAAGCSLDEAEPYGDCLTYDGGHAEHWDRWQDAGAGWLRQYGMPTAIMRTEYDEHPRGRVVKEPDNFVIYADRRLQDPIHIARICEKFGLSDLHYEVRSDSHYRPQR